MNSELPHTGSSDAVTPSLWTFSHSKTIRFPRKNNLRQADLLRSSAFKGSVLNGYHGDVLGCRFVLTFALIRPHDATAVFQV